MKYKIEITKECKSLFTCYDREEWITLKVGTTFSDVDYLCKGRTIQIIGSSGWKHSQIPEECTLITKYFPYNGPACSG